MAFEINFTNPMEGPTAFLTGYLNAKKRADAETARLRAQQQQRMADTIGQSIGNVGGALGQGWSRGVADKYRLQDQQTLEDQRAARQAEYQKQRDARQFDYDKQMAQYRADLSKDDHFFDTFQATPQEAEQQGGVILQNAPPEYKARLAQSFGITPDKLNPDDPAMRRHAFVQSTRDAAEAQREAQYQARYNARYQAEQAAKQQAAEQAQFQAWTGEQATISDGTSEAKYRSEYRGIEDAHNNGNIDADGYRQAMGQLQQKVLRGKLKPVEQPATNFQEWSQGKQPKPGVPYVAPDGRMTVFDAKGTPHTSTPPKTDAPQVTVQPPPPMPVSSPDGSQWIWDGKAYKEHTPKETPEQKAQHEQLKRDEAEFNAIAKDAAELQIPEKNDEGKVTKRLATPIERQAYIRDRTDAYWMVKRKVEEKRAAVAPTQQQAPQQRPQQYPEGTVAEDASGNRRVMKNGQWVPINGG